MTTLNATLRQVTAEYLTLASADTPIADEDAVKIDAAMAFMLAELREDGLCWWSDDAIPDACVVALKRILAAQLFTDYGKDAAVYGGGEMDGRERLSKLVPSTIIETVVAEYF